MEQISAQMGGVSQVWIQAILVVFFFSFFFLLPSHTVFIWLLWKGFLQLCSDSSHHWGTDSQIYWRGEKEKVLPGNYLQTGRDLAESTSLRTTSINRTQSDPDLAFKISLRSDHWWSKYRQVLWFAPKCAYFKSTKQMITSLPWLRGDKRHGRNHGPMDNSRSQRKSMCRWKHTAIQAEVELNSNKLLRGFNINTHLY